MEYESEWRSCPYNKAHRVPKSRIQMHIVKCQKNYPPLEICPYNATHRYPKDQFKEHVRSCPQKPLDEGDIKFRGGALTTPKPILQREFLAETDPDYECWD